MDDTWERVVLSDADYEHLIAEIYFEGKLIAILDREDGRENVRVKLNFPSEASVRVPFRDLNVQLALALKDLTL